MRKVLFLLLLSPYVSAEDKEVTVNFGAGVFNSGVNSLAESKVLTLGLNNFFYGRRMFYRYELGLFTDSAGNGRKGSAFGAGLLGVNVENPVFYAQGAFGASLLGTTDSYLGGHFQFTEEVSVGINGTSATKLGFFYKHMSSAGIYDPNVGRDFVGVKLSIPF